MKSKKVLIVYPNLMLVTQLPNNIALLSACLKEAGHDVKVFDSTLYKTSEETVDEARVKRLQVRNFSLKDCGVEIKSENIYDNFNRIVKDYNPDIIGVTVLDDTVKMGIDLIKSIEGKRPITFFGGVYATFNADELIKNKEVDIVCIGEGEEAFVELCNNLDKNINNIKNLWIKKNNNIIKNELRPPVDINKIPYEDFSVFEKQRIYRPMQGKMVASIPLLFDRGCPYSCTFCNAPSISNLYKENGYRYYRQKSIERIENEIKYQLDNNDNVSYLYFNSETFLSRSISIIKEFVEMYKKYNLPFWCQTRIETISEEKLKLLKEIKCDRISIGLEHGNSDFRKRLLNKKFTNEQVLNAFKLLNKYDFKVSVNNIMGFPEENRKLIFDTINLNRKIKCDSISGFVFQPYRGTQLREYCIEKGYLKDFDATDNLIGHSILDLPELSREELNGLLKTFVLYISLPKKYYKQIKIAEQNNEEGTKMFNKLKNILYKYYFKEK